MILRLQIGGEAMNEVYKTKLLGVIIDDKLNSKNQEEVTWLLKRWIIWIKMVSWLLDVVQS